MKGSFSKGFFMFTESDLIEKLLKIEALYLGATTSGEKKAAERAIESIQKRIKEYQLLDPPKEWQYSFNNQYEKQLFKALLQRYGLQPYRYKRQKYTTVMVLVSETFSKEVLWPEFVEMNKILRKYLDEMTDKVIKQATGQDNSEDELREEIHQISYQ